MRQSVRMYLDRKARYRVLLRRNVSFDGQFCNASQVTGIYCRPTRPLADVAVARATGFRSSLHCRPETSSGVTARQHGGYYELQRRRDKETK